MSSEGATQGDPIAVIIYGITTIPLVLVNIELIHDQPGITSISVAYADDFTVAGTLTKLKVLWRTLCDLRPKFEF